MCRILVVDDDPHIGLAIRARLERYGFRVSIADAGSHGIAALRNACLDPMIAARFGAARRLRKPFRPTTLPATIDACLSDADRRYVATSAVAADARRQRQGKFSGHFGEGAVAG